MLILRVGRFNPRRFGIVCSCPVKLEPGKDGRIAASLMSRDSGITCLIEGTAQFCKSLYIGCKL